MLRFLKDHGCTRFLPLLALLLVFAACSEDSTSPSGGDGDLPGSLRGVVAVSCQPDFLPIYWTLTTPSGASVRGQDSAFLDGMPSGNYQISWAPLAGWTPPVPNPRGKTLEGGVIEFFGNYYPQPGTLHIITEPAGLPAPWLLVLPDNSEISSVGDTTLVGLTLGDYHLYWGPVEGDWQTPPLISQELTSGEGLIFTGTYEQRLETFYISPRPQGIEAPWTLTGPEDVFEGVGSGTVAYHTAPDTLIPEGDYTLEWGDVPGYHTPDPITYTDVTDSASYHFAATYTLILGSVSVDGALHGKNFTWVLSGPDNFSLTSSGNRDLSGLVPGEYWISWPETDGWSSPDPTSQLLEAEGSLTFTAGHTPALTIIPAPEGLVIPWQVDGPGGYSQAGQGAAKLEDLALGQYTITWLEVDGWTAPGEMTGSLAADHGLILAGEYQQESQTISIVPEPLGVAAPWSVVGPAGFIANGVGQSAVPIGEVGNYRITWGPVDGMNTPGVTARDYAGEGMMLVSARYLPSFPMVQIPSGEFQMGSPNTESCRDFSETRHTIDLTRPYSIQATEVTNAQYRDLAQWAVDNGYATLGDRGLYDAIGSSTALLLDLGDPAQDLYVENGMLACQNPDHPIKEVTWYGAASYCDWLSLHRGLPAAYNHSTWQCNGFSPSGAVGFRLPTEAEWEKAARAGTGTAFANGTIGGGCVAPNLGLIGWWSGNAENWTHAVGQLAPNNWGIFDVHGNVAEWCNDWYLANYYTISPGTDPVGPSSGEGKVARGGFFFSPTQNCRSAARNEVHASNSSYSVGFRVVRTGG